MTIDTPAPRRRRLKPEQRREELLDAAEAMVLDLGSAQLTMEGLAGRAGVNKALLYHYFAGRDGLVLALQQRVADRFTAETRAAIGRHDGADGRLRALVAAWLVPSPTRDLARLLADVPADGLESQMLRQRIETAYLVAEMVRDLFPDLGDDAALAVAATFMAGTEGYVAAWRLAGWSDERAVTFYVTLIRGAVEAALRAPS